jgi:hypothetical protein
MTNNQQFLHLIKRYNKAVTYKHTLVSFDGDRKPYEAYVNLEDRWNGWLKPYILQCDVERMLNDIGLKWSIDSDKTITLNLSTEADLTDIAVIPLEKLDGFRCYYFGGMGWVFEKYNVNR